MPKYYYTSGKHWQAKMKWHANQPKTKNQKPKKKREFSKCYPLLEG